MAPPGPLLTALGALGLVDPSEPPPMVPLTGGVSSEIWRLDLPSGPVVAKQALARLKVAGDWRVPVTRTRYEVAWMRRAGAIRPGATPALRAWSDDVIVMEYLDPLDHPVWKAELLAGRVTPSVGGEVAAHLGAIHASTAADPNTAREFDNAALFAALRLDPYFAATARAHADLAGRFAALRASYRDHALALVHGDVSPKNVLLGPSGPVLLDAECATWGDPAFDVAFCVTHLLLKMVAVPARVAALATTIDSFTGTYRELVTWEPFDHVDRRVAATAAGLLLARIDGLSPVEYLDERQRESVRRAARALVADPPPSIGVLTARWRRLLGVSTGAGR